MLFYHPTQLSCLPLGLINTLSPFLLIDVITGGELAACVLTDSIIRLIPGVISDETSALNDSFQDNLLPPPIYTRPSEFNGWKVPGVLLSGDSKKIEAWREKKALERTNNLRPDILK